MSHSVLLRCYIPSRNTHRHPNAPTHHHTNMQSCQRVGAPTHTRVPASTRLRPRADAPVRPTHPPRHSAPSSCADMPPPLCTYVLRISAPARFIIYRFFPFLYTVPTNCSSFHEAEEKMRQDLCYKDLIGNICYTRRIPKRGGG